MKPLIFIALSLLVAASLNISFIRRGSVLHAILSGILVGISLTLITVWLAFN